MNKLMIASAVAGVLALSGAISVANAEPLLQIVTTGDSLQEHAGDPSGSVYPWNGGPGPGAGIPWHNTETGAGWPLPPPPSGFSPDGSAPDSQSASGFDASYLWLSESANVKFEFMGAGDSSLANSFWLNPTATFAPNGSFSGGTWVQLFQDGQSSNPTNPCPVTPNGATAPSCDILTGGLPVQNEYNYWINVAAGGGYVPFAYDIDGVPATGAGPFIVKNDGTNNPSDDSGLPGYILAADPYQAPGPHSCADISPIGQQTCNAVYAGLSDRSRVGELDHDYQDMGVRISVGVPEPGSLALLSAGLLGFGALRRRRAV